jgi:putative transposase
MIPSSAQALQEIPEPAWQEAVRRDAIIRSLAQCERPGRAAVVLAANQLGLSVSQIYRLLGAFRAKPVTQTLVVAARGRKKGSRLLPPTVETAIERGIATIHKTREKPQLRRLHREVRHDCLAAGLKPPSLKAVSARVSAHSLKEMVTAREGADVARDRFSPAVGGLKTMAPLHLVQIDHTLVDIQLADEHLRAVLGRPWLTLVLDVHTRSVLGLYVSLDPPSSVSVALAVAQAVLPKQPWLAARDIALTWPMHGCVGIIHLDNAAEFHTKALARGCQQHGFRLEYRVPATPHHGGHIERLMGTLMQRVHALPGTTFSNVAQRGDYPSEQRAVLTLHEFERVLALEVLGPYHNDVHTALQRTPAAAWAAWIAAGGQPVIPADPAAFLRDFLPFKERVVGRQGLRLFGIHYYDGGLASLIGTGTKLRVKYDPRDLSAVFAEMPGGGYLRVPYADLARPAITLWEHGHAVRTLRAEGRKTIDEQAIFAAIAAQRRVVANAYAESKAARRSAARTPSQQDGIASPQPPLPPQPTDEEHDPDARVPVITADDIAKTEFWS